MADLTMTLSLRRRWWTKPAFYAGFLAAKMGLIKDAPSDEYFDGVEPASARVAKWMVSRALLRIVKPDGGNGSPA